MKPDYVSDDHGEVLLVLLPGPGGDTSRASVEEALTTRLPMLVVGDPLHHPDAEWVEEPPSRSRGDLFRFVARWAEQRGFHHIVTLDADGRFDPRMAVQFAEAIEREPWSVIVGHPLTRDGSPRTGPRYRLSGFLLRLACGIDIAEARSRFRAIPLPAILHSHFEGKHGDYDVEVLVRSVWAGLNFLTIDVFESPPQGKIASRSLGDWLHSSLSYSRLALRNALPWPHRRLFNRDPDELLFSWRHPFRYWKSLHGRVSRQLGEGDQRLSLRHPIRSLQILRLERTSPREISLACMLGVFLGALPLIALHTIVIVFYATRLRLNRAIAYYASKLCLPFVPPFVPALNIEAGHFLLNGRFITLEDLNSKEDLFRTLFAEVHLRLWEYLVGSIVVAPILSVLVGIIVYIIARLRPGRA